MGSMTAQRDLIHFLGNPENVQKFDGLVEDIHDALMGYQVCTPKQLTFAISNIHHRLHYNKTSMMRAVSRL